MTVLCLWVIFIVSRYLAFDPAEYFPEQRELYLRRELLLGVHVVSGILALGTGPFQFVPKIRRRLPNLHRFLGYGYLTGATGAGLSGLGLATTAYGGPVSRTGFFVFAVLILATTWTALGMVLAHRIGDHRRWMIRSFALMFAAVMLRVLGGMYAVLTSAGLQLSFATAYAGIAWLCWVPNLLIAVWVTRRPTRAARRVAHTH
jgi:hypothetical protein